MSPSTPCSEPSGASLTARATLKLLPWPHSTVIGMWVIALCGSWSVSVEWCRSSVGADGATRLRSSVMHRNPYPISSTAGGAETIGSIQDASCASLEAGQPAGSHRSSTERGEQREQLV